jgi:hypothetical protein
MRANQELILVGLTNFRFRPMPRVPKLNRKRALLVLTKIDEILAWEQRKEAGRDPRFVESGGICAKSGQGNTGGSRI